MLKERFVVEGLAGRKSLKGEIPVYGAKNAVLKALAASILFEDEVKLGNVPQIEDVERIKELLRASGANVSEEKNQVTIVPPKNWNTELEHSIAEQLRASVVLTGPMLAKEGNVSFPFPGGCVLGERPIDLFLTGFAALGAETSETDGEFNVHTKNKMLRGAKIFFPFVSVTATETLMLAATLAQGETILENAAMEPEISELAKFLNECGAKIDGAGTEKIRIVGTGGKPLRAEGKIFQIPPDRIEAGSFAILSALCGEEVTITNCRPKEFGALLSLFSRAGVLFELGKDFIRIRKAAFDAEYTAVPVRTHEYPGFPTDLQAPMAVFLTQCKGEATILECIFDGRFRYAEDLTKMGADITVMNPHRILIKGPTPLSARNLESPDLRAGLAYLIAACVASGTSIVDNAYVIDRGYEHIEERLQGIGLSIRRELAR